jgi:hypothetical protein
MVSIGTGPGDPRAWVRAYPRPPPATCRELARLGLIPFVPGHGYYPGTRP